MIFDSPSSPQQSTSLLATGISGLVGSRVATLLQDQFSFENLDINHPTNPTDITNLDQVKAALSVSSAQFLLHFAAFTDVTAAWNDRNNKDGLAYRVNVIGTKNIIEACQENNIHLIHLSTAYVFDGNQVNPYLETDQPNPIEWYGQTKWEAEQAIMASDASWTILRIDQPFRPDYYQRPDVVRKIISGLKQGTLPPQFTNQFFGPTYIDDLAITIKQIISQKQTGLFHATNGEQWSPYEFATLVQKIFHLNGKVDKGNLDQYLKTTNRPYQHNTALNNEKIVKALRLQPHTIMQALGEILL
ncbi:MAG TPA: SDR family oxidoreductase [Candidatus Woesebacteria bacterium]|nr:SDR family oxidoreductase [Candidatus Woesebacteria bacterium]